MICIPDGPESARIMIVGEAPGVQEEMQGSPFVGSSGQELNKMLHEAGILRSECFVTNVIRVRPPGNDVSAFIPMKKKDITAAHVLVNGRHVLPIVKEGYDLLIREIATVKPNVIIALGNAALWAVTGKWGIMHWRGSMLGGGDTPVVVPTIHPAAILRQWEMRAMAVNDMRRAARFRNTRVNNPPDRRFLLRPSYQTTVDTLTMLLEGLDAGTLSWLDFDIETPIPPKFIECVGLSWTRSDAICIPFTAAGIPDYFMEEEEAQVIFMLYKVLTHPKVKVRGQNLLFDCQVVHRYWHFIPRVAQDTMLSHHILFPGLKKKLDVQASLYVNHYIQWKPEKRKEKEGG